EVADVEESTGAAYAMLKFGGNDAYIGKIKISGNIGLRYVGTKDDSSGFVRYATIPGLNSTLCPRVAAVTGGLVGAAPIPGDPDFVAPPNGGAYYAAFCYLGPQDLAY